MANARAVLTAFVRGKALIEGEDLKRLDPHEKEVWEFRTGLALRKLQLRLFGWFPQPNHFVVVHGKRRGDLDISGSKAWDRAIQRVVEARRDLLPSEYVYRGMSYGDYIY